MTDTAQPLAEQAGLSADDIRRVLEALDASEWDEALITVGDVQIAVSRNGGTLPGVTPPAAPPTANPTAASTGSTPAPVAPAASAPAAATATPVAPPSAPGAAVAEGRTVESPSVGVFWRAPEPGAPPFVEVGTRVAVGDTLGIVEVMKLMSHVDAPVAGRVVAVHAENAQSVEHGAVLFTIAPDGV